MGGMGGFSSLDPQLSENHLIAVTANKSVIQFSVLGNLFPGELQFQDCSRSQDRLDKFFYNVMGQNPNFFQLCI